MKEKRLITAALPYANNLPHLGHIVGSHLPADILARYARSKGYDTLFVGGTDDHGTPSLLSARETGVDVQTFCAAMHKAHKNIYDWFNISYDNFSRTSGKANHELTKEFFLNAHKKGYISEKTLQQFYCPKDEMFLPDRYILGTCPKCDYDAARGDQCEKCTSVMDETTLKNPKCAICGTTPELRESKHLFFKFDKSSKDLESWLNKQKHWRHQVRNLALAWIKEGLKERCITRDLRNGISVPLEGYEDKVFYVWFDAPIGYVASSKEVSKEWDSFWKNKDCKIFHVVGKDNIPFHTLFWPASLLLQDGFNLPYQVVGLQYLNYEGGKFSKSQKRGVFCEKLPESGIHPDVLRAYLTFAIPETDDSEFKWSEFESRVNADLIGNFGNFVHRSLTFIHNKLDGEVKKPKTLTKEDEILQAQIKEHSKKIEEYLEKAELRHAFQEILLLSDKGNKYFNDQAPWLVLKEDKDRAKEILYVCANLARTLSILAHPYIPQTTEKILSFLNLKEHPEKDKLWDKAGDIVLDQTHKIKEPEVLFTKITPEFLEEFKQKVAETSELKEFLQSH